MKPNLLYIDQYGGHYWARTVKELCAKLDRTKVTKMYVDGIDGKSYHTGYVIGDLWLSCFTPMRKEA